MRNPSYQRKEPVVVTERMRRQIAGAVAELDLAQISISRRLTPAQRTYQALSMIAAAHRVAAHRLRVRQPELSQKRGNQPWLALSDKCAPNGCAIAAPIGA